jgi:hypothetical protein
VKFRTAVGILSIVARNEGGGFADNSVNIPRQLHLPMLVTRVQFHSGYLIIVSIVHINSTNGRYLEGDVVSAELLNEQPQGMPRIEVI